jgi:CheY-like chemotaxis protein
MSPRPATATGCKSRKKDKFDVAILDLKMPDMDGTEEIHMLAMGSIPMGILSALIRIEDEHK